MGKDNSSRAFMPNEMIAVVEHPDDGSSPADIKAFIEAEMARLGTDVDNFCDKCHQEAKYHRKPKRFRTPQNVKVERVVQLKRRDSDKHQNVAKCFSLVYLEFENLSDEEIIEHAYIFYDFRRDQNKLPKRLQQVINQDSGDTDQTTPTNGLQLTAIMPNWLLASAPNEPPEPPGVGGSGGPGTKPKSVSPDPFAYDFLDPQAPWNFVLDQSRAGNSGNFDILKSALGKRDTNAAPVDHVKVIILDTVPPYKPPVNAYQDARSKGYYIPFSIEEAYDTWSEQHPLLKRLLAHDPDNPPEMTNDHTVEFDHLKITYNPEFNETFDANGNKISTADPEVFDMKRASNHEQYPYFVMDHGLFIAGIIHTLAPSVPIHLIEVLNAYGYFSLEHLAWGLEKALVEADEDTRIVVNMSLMLSLPRVDGHKSDTASIILPTGEELDVRVKNDQEFAYYLLYVLLNLSELITISGADNQIDHLGGVLVAAAGNDGKQNGTRPKARYPAAFDNVYGVAALGKDAAYTDYSNEGDQPPYNGFAAFGGDSKDDFAEDGSNNRVGMLGVYIGDFPDPESTAEYPFKTKKNENGWGYWAGTSFATPVVVGCLAQLLAVDSARTADEAVSILRLAFSDIPLEEQRIGIQQVGLAVPESGD